MRCLLFSSLPGCRLPLLPGRQRLHLPGARVRAQRGRAALPLTAVRRLPGAAPARAAPAEHAQPALLRARPHGLLPQGSPGALGKPAQRYHNDLPHAFPELPPTFFYSCSYNTAQLHLGISHRLILLRRIPRATGRS